MPKKESQGIYEAIIIYIFQKYYQQGLRSFDFNRDEIIEAADILSVNKPKNLGDLIYNFRFRSSLPQVIIDTAPSGFEWIIENSGISSYRFKLSRINRILPRTDMLRIKIPNATPEIISRYALSDEQSLLARVRYNRLIDVFLGITTYSLQNHLRTTVAGIGQIEIDEIYVGINREGVHFIVPVQAKTGSDQISVVQTKQDVLCCREKFRNLVCRPISVQFMENDVIVMFEMVLEGDEVKVVREKHYLLSAWNEIVDSDLSIYRSLAEGIDG